MLLVHSVVCRMVLVLSQLCVRRCFAVEYKYVLVDTPLVWVITTSHAVAVLSPHSPGTAKPAEKVRQENHLYRCVCAVFAYTTL